MQSADFWDCYFPFFSFLLNNYTVLYQFVSEDLAGVLHVYLYGFGVTTHKTDKTDFGYQMLIEGLKKIFKPISLWLHLGLSLTFKIKRSSGTNICYFPGN